MPVGKKSFCPGPADPGHPQGTDVHILIIAHISSPSSTLDTISHTMTSLGIAIVTGAAQGIGRAISLRLADDGFDVAINDIQSNKANLEAVGAEIAAKGRRTTLIIADVRDEGEVKGMIDQVVKELGGLDVVRVLLTKIVERSTSVSCPILWVIDGRECGDLSCGHLVRKYAGHLISERA